MCPEMMVHVYDPFSFEEANDAFNSKLQPWSLESDSWLSFGISDISTNDKIVATCSVNNLGSYLLLEKLGFSREGCLQQNVIIKGQYVDDYVYGLCKSAL